MRKVRQDLGFVALKIEGGILPAEFLQKIVSFEAKAQSAGDYDLPKGTTVKEEIGRAWRIACAEWSDYQEQRLRKDVDQSKAAVDGWLTSFLKFVLTHQDLAKQGIASIGERKFPITHHSVHEAVPLVLTSHEFELDKTYGAFGDEGRKRSPHGLLQEFLNADDKHLWGIVSNGLQIRLLRDNLSLTRPAYIEADLERIFQEQLYADFAALWLIFHASRFTTVDGKPTACLMERWRDEGHETGERALASLRNGVTEALLQLGNGFLNHPNNEPLRTAMSSGAFPAMDYYKELLRLVYRLLFLFTVEERNLLHIANTNDETKSLYSHGYSVARLKESALLKRNYDKYADNWEALRITFGCLSKGSDVLALPALGGLFDTEQCPYLDSCLIANKYLLNAIFALSFFRSGSILARVNYRDMGTEELGSVYESLLELHPYIDVESQPWSFSFLGADNDEANQGSERKLSGSYYTPQSLVNELIKSALESVIELTIKNNQSAPKEALLNLKIIDPACGSGHFLLAAARRLSIEVARLESQGDIPEEDARRHALREVSRRCIYGVDKNQLAVELCKAALWIETVEPGKPLSFLDAHIRYGDSLIGVCDAKVLDADIPGEAYKPLFGDDTSVTRELKRKNGEGSRGTVQGNIFLQAGESTKATHTKVEEMPEDTLAQIEAKKSAWKILQESQVIQRDKLRADIYTGAFFASKATGKSQLVPLTEDLTRISMGTAPRQGINEVVNALADKFRFFHWPFEFPDVFSNGGFDVVLGNPPWERIKLQEQEFFAVRNKEIAGARTKAIRENLIKSLASNEGSASDKALWNEYVDCKRAAEAASLFVRHSGRYPLCGRGDVNTYSIFAEMMKTIINLRGRVGCIVPSGIATDDTTKFFFQDISRSGLLFSLYDFENRQKLFRSVDSRMKFCLLTLSGKEIASTTGTDFAFFLQSVEDLKDNDRHFTLSAQDIELLNPNTGTCPIFRSKRDAELTKQIYKRVPILIKEGTPEVNPWGLKFLRMFDMAMDSGLFRSRPQLESAGFSLNGNIFEKASGKSTDRYFPLYEAKMIHHFDHRASEVVISDTARVRKGQPSDLSLEQHQSAATVPMPRYWVSSIEVQNRIPEGFQHQWFIGYAKITSPTNARSLISTILPKVGVGDSMPLIFLPSDTDATDVACLQGNLSSFSLDYILRQKLGGTNLLFFIMQQLPIFPPSCYLEKCSWDYRVSYSNWISERVLELIYTSFDLTAFGKAINTDKPSQWNEERRFMLRCELDAAFFWLYGFSSEEVDYIMEQFPSIKEKEIAANRKYLTKQLILECYDAMQTAITSGAPYESKLLPPSKLAGSLVTRI